jgi:hypothetical protein
MVWWICSRVYATVNKFVTAPKPIDEADLPTSEDEVLDETNTAGLAKATARKRNTVAIANYAMPFMCEMTLGMIFVDHDGMAIWKNEQSHGLAPQEVQASRYDDSSRVVSGTEQDQNQNEEEWKSGWAI